jgi:hypothetical protein
MNFLRRMLDVITYPLRSLLSAPGRLLSGSQRLRQISVPARVAILTEILLVICLALTLFLFIRTENLPHFAKLTPRFYVVVAILILLIPLVLYKALKLWLEGDVSPFADIDHAWKAGLEELERQGISLLHTPLFLILGSANEWQEKAIFDAARLHLNVREVPKGPAALHWYGNAEGVYLVCSSTSNLSKLSHLASEADQETGQKPSFVADSSPSSSIRGTIIAGPAEPERPASPAAAPEPREQARVSPTADIRTMTMMLPHSDVESAQGNVVETKVKQILKLSKQDVSEQARRLEYVGHLLHRARQPLCPVNGIMTLLPFGLIQRSAPDAIELQRAVQQDLASLRRVLMVRCPLTATVVGLEEEGGFQELVRRVGRDRALSQRFGKGFSLSNSPMGERLEAFCAYACGVFEDWCYALFREKGALSKPGNTKLFTLLCKVRRNVQSRLADILANAYGYDPNKESRAQAWFFGGCYFAATGDTEDRQAFVKGIFDKLPEQQEELEWTDEALLRDQNYQTLTNVCLSLATVMLLGLMGMIVFKFKFMS